MRLSQLHGVVVVVVAALLLSRAGPAHAQQGDPQISGRVVRADNGAPIVGATVLLTQTAGNPVGNGRAGVNGRVTTRTDSSGRYTVQGLPDGAYLISASADGFLDGDVNDQLTDRGQNRYPPARPLPKIDSTSHLRGVDVHLIRPATVSGTVITKDGRPLRSGIEITAIRVLTRPGASRRFVFTGSRDTTDAGGHFTLSRLRPDTYGVCVNCFTNHAVATDSSGGIIAFGGGATWYGDTPSAATAKAITLAEGEGRTGADCEVDFGMPPMTHVSAVSGPLRDATLTLDVPTTESRQFIAAHFALSNTGTTPLAGAWRHCAVDDTVTNSAGKVATDVIGCRWQGVTTGDETLRPGATTTTDLDLFGDRGGLGLPPLCRAGPWTVKLTIESLLAPVRFAPIPFQVNWTDCSDSPPLAVSGGAPINWAPASYYGVRLGAQLRDANMPSATASHGETHQPQFRANEHIIASIFVDTISDAPLHLRVGPGRCRVSVTRVGASADAVEIPPTAAEADVPGRDIVVPPHTQMQIGEEALGDRYRLAPGDYRVAVGFLMLPGLAAEATVRTSGFVEDLGNVVVFRLTITP